MAKDPTAAKLAALGNESTADELREALRDKSSHVMARAAKLIAARGWKELEPELAAAYGKLKKDPQCTAKLALVAALSEFDTTRTEILFAAARTVQWEDSWGRPVDAAAPLRGLAAMALAANTTAPVDRVYRTLVDLLTDEQLTTRSHAARALGQLVHPQSELLLRFKIQSGDAEPEVIGACFDALLEVAPGEAVAYLEPYLERDAEDPLAFEAASALGASRTPAAFELMITKIAENHAMADTLLRCLTPQRFRVEWRERIATAVKASGNEQLERTFAREYLE